jgi:hypothetical protein
MKAAGSGGTMRRSRISFLVAVLICAIAISGQQPAIQMLADCGDGPSDGNGLILVALLRLLRAVPR